MKDKEGETPERKIAELIPVWTDIQAGFMIGEVTVYADLWRAL